MLCLRAFRNANGIKGAQKSKEDTRLPLNMLLTCTLRGDPVTQQLSSLKSLDRKPFQSVVCNTGQDTTEGLKLLTSVSIDSSQAPTGPMTLMGAPTIPREFFGIDLQAASRQAAAPCRPHSCSYSASTSSVLSACQEPRCALRTR